MQNWVFPIEEWAVVAGLVVGLLSYGLAWLIGSRRTRQALEQQEHWRSRAEQLACESRAMEVQLDNLEYRFRLQAEDLADNVGRQESLRLELQDKIRRISELETRQGERERHMQAQIAQFREDREHLKQEFELLSHRIFEARGATFSEQSRLSLDTVLAPFKEQLGEFRSKVEDLHLRDIRQKAELSAELQQLKSLNAQMTKEAHDLSTALRGQKKTQGNWGELVLENVLDRSGLRLGQDYHREMSFTTDDGRRRPDVIVNLPQGRHLVIDSKVSLNAYQDYVNAEDEWVRKSRLKDHVDAMKQRIQELADKRYFELPGLTSPELVFMFVPIESAFVEALRGDSELFQKALQANVLVATPTTLLTSLNIVRQLWRFEEQSRHSAELADRAAKFHDKLRVFLESLNAIGLQIDRAQDTWKKAFGQLVQGKGNLISQAADFRELGVAVKAELPANFVDHARLELDLRQPKESASTPTEHR